MKKESVGVVQTKYYNIEEPIELESGKTLDNITVAYETYGELNREKDNAILICHALSGDAHAAGWHEGDKKPGWWEIVIGPGKALDSEKYFIICSNVLGGCKGTTGPSSINPKTGKEYGIDFPVITIKDMVNVQKKLVDAFGIDKLAAVVGGSMGGMQTLQWIVSYPEMMKKAVAIATTARSSPQQIAFNEVGRQSIVGDPNWNGGNYYGTDKIPKEGLSVARMIAHITYLSDESMYLKFGRDLQDKDDITYDLSMDFQASGRSSLLTTTTAFFLRPKAFLSTKRVWGMQPSKASTSSRTPSTMVRMRSTSPPKSAWPGVSMMLIFVPL